MALVRGGDLERACAVFDEVDRTVASSATDDTTHSTTPRTLGERHLALARAELLLALGDPAASLASCSGVDLRDIPRAALLRATALVALARYSEAHVELAGARTASSANGARPALMRIEAQQGRAYLGERRRLDARRASSTARSSNSS